MSQEKNCPVEVTPYDQSGLIKTPKTMNLNYTNQDFWSMKTRLVNFIRERFGPNGTVIPNTFNDMVESDIAIMLIENWAFLADTLSFKMDQIANEVYIDTVVELENAFRLCKAQGFDPLPPIAARALFAATINNPLTTDLFLPNPVTIFAGTKQFELYQMDSNGHPLFDSNIVIPAGATVNQNIIGLEGQSFSETREGTGEVAQTIALLRSPVIYDSIRVEVNGIPWQQVPYFTDSQPRPEYRVEFDSEWNAFVIFGNNRAGLIPSQASRIRITYRVGGGVAGNIVTGFAETQVQAPVPGMPFSVPVTIKNYTKGEFGYDGDTIEDIRVKLPRWTRTQNRAVSGDDYKTLADQFATAYQGQIGKATAVLRNYGCSANVIDLYILARDGTNGLAPANGSLKAAFTDHLNTRKMLTDYVCLRDGVVVYVDTNVEITIDKFYRKFEQEYRAMISSKMNNLFSLSKWEYGQTLKASDVVKEMADLKNVDEVTVNFTTADPENGGDTVTTKFYEIIRPDTLTISFMYT